MHRCYPNRFITDESRRYAMVRNTRCHFQFTMKSTAIAKVLGLLAILMILSSCARPPFQSGTWIGVASRVTLYTEKGERCDAIQLKITDGPTVTDESYRPHPVHPSGRQFIEDSPVLVTRKLVPINLDKYEGRTLVVRGKIDRALQPVHPSSRAKLYFEAPDQEPLGGRWGGHWPIALVTSEPKIEFYK